MLDAEAAAALAAAAAAEPLAVGKISGDPHLPADSALSLVSGSSSMRLMVRVGGTGWPQVLNFAPEIETCCPVCCPVLSCPIFCPVTDSTNVSLWRL